MLSIRRVFQYHKQQLTKDPPELSDIQQIFFIDKIKDNK